jgi:hypothetical protein
MANVLGNDKGVNVVLAWIWPEYRKMLTPEELASMPPLPVPPGELTNDEIKKLAIGNICYTPSTCRIQDATKLQS